MAWVLLLLILVQPFLAVSYAFEGGTNRFFRTGDGNIHIRNVQNGLQAKVCLLASDGSLNESALNSVDKVFGFSSQEPGEHISPRLLFFLDHFSDRIAPGKVIHLQSGYRAPEYNQRLRKTGRNVALTSTHMDAMAIDFFIEGVDGKSLWEMVRKENCCGVGHYGGKTIHMDSGRPRFWEAATSKVSSGESEMNRRIHLSTYYDRYRPGEVVRLALASISDFAFGVMADSIILKEDGTSQKVRLFGPASVDGDCLPVDDPRTARSLCTTLPGDLSPGRYRIGVRFCNRPFPQMPLETLSNPIEVVP